jgi:hypothetical protein
MARKKGVNVNLRLVICVEIVGRKRKPQDGRRSSTLMTREDDGLAHAFLEWQSEHHIFGVVQAGRNGGGSYLGFFDPEDLERIKSFFRDKGFRIK